MRKIPSCSEAALRYLAMGFHPIPCRPRSKEPHLKWSVYQRRAPTRRDIRRWWKRWPDANVALVLGRGTIAVDLDGTGAMKLLRAHGVRVPPSPTSRTGRGRHHFLSVPHTVPDHVNLLTDGKSQVDIKGRGYVVVPPSIHPSGKRYEWETPLTTSLPPAPARLLTLIKKRGRGARVGPSGSDWAATALVGPIREGARNTTLSRLTGRLLAKGLTLAEVQAILLLWGQATCRPPLPAKTVLRTIDSTAKTQTRRQTRLLSRFPRVSKLMSVPDRPPQWLVEDIIARGDCGFIAGEPRTYKTWLLCALAVSLSTREDFLGFEVPRRRRVLLLAEEDNRRRLQARLRCLLAGRKPPASLRIGVQLGLKLDDERWLKRLRRVIRVFRPALVLMDPLRRFHSLDENSNKEMGRLIDILNAIRRKYHCGFLIVHHSRKLKPGGSRHGRGGQEMAGAGALHGWSEASLYLTWKDGMLVVTPEHKDVPALHPFRIAVKETQGPSGLKSIQIKKLGPVTTKKGQKLQDLLAVLPRSDARTVRQLAEQLGWHPNTVRTHLNALKKQNLVMPQNRAGHAPGWRRTSSKKGTVL